MAAVSSVGEGPPLWWDAPPPPHTSCSRCRHCCHRWLPLPPPSPPLPPLRLLPPLPQPLPPPLPPPALQATPHDLAQAGRWPGLLRWWEGWLGNSCQIQTRRCIFKKFNRPRTLLPWPSAACHSGRWAGAPLPLAQATNVALTHGRVEVFTTSVAANRRAFAAPPWLFLDRSSGGALPRGLPREQGRPAQWFSRVVTKLGASVIHAHTSTNSRQLQRQQWLRRAIHSSGNASKDKRTSDASHCGSGP